MEIWFLWKEVPSHRQLQASPAKTHKQDMSDTQKDLFWKSCM